MDEMIRTPYGQMPAYVAAPQAAGPWPGVVVIHDFAGMSRDLRNQAGWLAGEGYLAAAPDLYYWGSRLRCLWTIIREPAAGATRRLRDGGPATPFRAGALRARRRRASAPAGRRTGMLLFRLIRSRRI